MATTSISQSPYLRVASSVFATIWVGFGIIFTVRPRSALDFFEFNAPASASDEKLVCSFIVLYAIRDLFMGLAVCVAAYFGDRRILGWMLIAGGGVAFVDGAVCRAQIGKGEWNHWGYAPVLVVVGCTLLGALDRAKGAKMN